MMALEENLQSQLVKLSSSNAFLHKPFIAKIYFFFSWSFNNGLHTYKKKKKLKSFNFQKVSIELSYGKSMGSKETNFKLN